MHLARARKALTGGFGGVFGFEKTTGIKKQFRCFSEQAATAGQVEYPDSTITSIKTNPFTNTRSNWTHYQGQIQAALLASNKAYIRTKLESSLLQENVVEIPAIRFRTKQDTLLKLKERREVACVLNDDYYTEVNETTGEIIKKGREIHFVLEMNQLKQIRKLKDATLRPMRIMIEGRLFDVRFLDLHIHPGKEIKMSI